MEIAEHSLLSSNQVLPSLEKDRAVFPGCSYV